MRPEHRVCRQPKLQLTYRDITCPVNDVHFTVTHLSIIMTKYVVNYTLYF